MVQQLTALICLRSQVAHNHYKHSSNEILQVQPLRSNSTHIHIPTQRPVYVLGWLDIACILVLILVPQDQY